MRRELDKRPSMDYEELRRRHEMYKSRTRKAAPQPARQVRTAAAPQPETPVRPTPVETDVTQNVAVQPAQSVETVSAPVVETVEPVVEAVVEKPQEIAQAVDIPEEQLLDAPVDVEPAVAEPVLQADEIEAPLDDVFEDTEDVEQEFVDDELNDVFSDDELEDDGEEEEDAPDTNPFAQFISIYHNARDFFKKRRAAKKGEADADEPNYEDEFADLEDENVFEPEEEGISAKDREAPAADVPLETSEAKPLDVPEEKDGENVAETFDDEAEDDGFVDDEAFEDDGDDEDYEDDEEKRPLFARIVGAFVRRIDDDEEADEDAFEDDEDYDVDADEDEVKFEPEAIIGPDEEEQTEVSDVPSAAEPAFDEVSESEELEPAVEAQPQETKTIRSLFEGEAEDGEPIYNLDEDASEFEEDEADDEEYEDDDEAPAGGGFKRFLYKFIRPVDDDLLDDADEDDEEYLELHGDYEENEGGYSMDEQKNVANLNEELAQDLGERTLSRRERRELAARQAAAEAEKAAAAVEENVVAAAHEQKQDFEGSFEETKAGFEMPALDQEEGANRYSSMMDEPTREFKPVQRGASSLFDTDAGEADEDDEDDEDDEEDDRASRRKAKRAAKAAKKKQRYAPEEDEDDEDDDDYDDEDDEEDRRGHRGHRAFRQDEYDDYDDDDDDYDDYEDDDDDDYDDDDYDNDHPVRRGFFRFLKWIFGIAVVLVLLVFLLNILGSMNRGPLKSNLYNRVRDWSPKTFDRVFPYGRPVEDAAEVKPEELPAGPADEATDPAAPATEGGDATQPDDENA